MPPQYSFALRAKFDSTARDSGQSASLALTLSEEFSRLAVVQYCRSTWMWPYVYGANVIKLQGLRRRER